MSFAGHVFAMITSLKNNKRDRKTMYNEKGLIYSNYKKIKKNKRRAIPKLSEELKEEIDYKMEYQNKKENLKKLISFIIAIIIILPFTIYLIHQLW